MLNIHLSQKFDTEFALEHVPVFLSNFPKRFLNAALELKSVSEKQVKYKNLANCLNSFSEKLAEKSNKTRSSYLCDVKNILSYVTDNFFNKSNFSQIKLEQITDEQIEKTIDWLFLESKYTAKTLIRRKYGWNKFCKFLGKNEWKITRKVNKTSYLEKDIIDTEQIISMILFCEKMIENTLNINNKILWLRRIVAINIGFNEGLRASEYKNVKFDDVLLKEKIEIRASKHDSWRTIPITSFTKKAIKNLHEFLELHHKLPKNGGVFENNKCKPMSTRTFQRWIRKVATHSNIPLHLAKTHGLRHRFAKNFLKEHKELSVLSEILGHKSLETTRIYTKATQAELKNLLQTSSNSARNQ